MQLKMRLIYKRIIFKVIYVLAVVIFLAVMGFPFLGVDPKPFKIGIAVSSGISIVFLLLVLILDMVRYKKGYFKCKGSFINSLYIIVPAVWLVVVTFLGLCYRGIGFH